MFVVYKWDKWEADWGHKYFWKKENAEACAHKLREEDRWVNVELEEVKTED